MKHEEKDMRLAANAIRVLVADMVEKAKSGHPGGSMGQADVAATLWLEYLKFVPSDPKWVGRDRLVFSGGHCSPLVYSLLHLSGTDSLSIDELKQFRQFGSRTAERRGSWRSPSRPRRRVICRLIVSARLARMHALRKSLALRPRTVCASPAS